MNEELQQKLLDYLSALEQATAEAGGFLQSELPLVVHEIVAWVWWGSLLRLVFYAVVLTVLLLVVYFGSKRVAQASFADAENASWFLFVMGTILSILFFGTGAMYNAQELVKASVAPRVVVIEKINELRK